MTSLFHGTTAADLSGRCPLPVPLFRLSCFRQSEEAVERTSERTSKDDEEENEKNKSSFVVFLGRRKKREATKEGAEAERGEGHFVRSNNSISNSLYLFQQ